MNKKYIVDEDSKVTVITDSGETIERKDKYTKNTDEIISLENLLEMIQTKIGKLSNTLKEHLSKKQVRKIDMLLTPLVVLLVLGLIAIPAKSLLLAKTIGIICIPTLLVIELVDFILYNKSKSKVKKYEQKINEESHRINKINKRIDTLSQDKTPVKAEKINEFIEVKEISNYNFDASDYFIEKYLIDKRTKEMSHSKKKVRKLTKENNSIYKI